MTTLSLTHPASSVASEAEGDLVKAVHEVLREAGPDGVPLMATLQALADGGHDLSAVTPTIIQLIRAGHIDLTADRSLRWAGEAV
jgi:hypothetical protein